MLPSSVLERVLAERLNSTGDDIKKLMDDAKKASTTLENLVITKGVATEDKLYQETGELLQIPYISLTGKEIPIKTLALVPEPLAEAHSVICFDKNKTTMSLALVDPLDLQTIEFLHRNIGLEPVIHITSPGEIKKALRRYHADLKQDIAIVEEGEELTGAAKTKALKKASEEQSVITIMENILEHAIFDGASDIHLEPAEKGVVVRYRVDGVLRQVMQLPKELQSGILARLKILANLKIDEHMMPQDGRFKIKVQGETFSFRLSIMPVYGGEKAVMRILTEGQKPLTLDQLGFLPLPRKDVEESLKKPHGMILVTGPTGSGKTTTLYSMLGILNEPGVNICTIEDPIEYHVAGINQSQVNTRVGFNFASGLRAFLRQDPDIIMVGEIRDKETAEIAIHAAMTGHEVLSTLHTNDAPTTIPRLTDMDIPAFLIAFTVNIIIAQRLVRRICDQCRESFTLDEAALEELKRVFAVQNIVELLNTQKVKPDGEAATNPAVFYRGKGCRRCGETGYKGRVGIYEVLPIDQSLVSKINERANANTIKEYALERGMITMLQDGIIKSKMGVTTVEEVLRVTRE